MLKGTFHNGNKLHTVPLRKAHHPHPYLFGNSRSSGRALVAPMQAPLPLAFCGMHKAILEHLRHSHRPEALGYIDTLLCKH